MTQEEKQLLLKDLCARLPYGVKYCRDSWNYEWDQEMSVVEVLEDIDKEGYINYHKVYKVEDIKPYFRPLSSMTEEEEESLRENTGLDIFKCTVNKELEDLWTTDCSVKDLFCLYSWLNEHHFDYNGLIEKGLALEAPEGMY